MSRRRLALLLLTAVQYAYAAEPELAARADAYIQPLVEKRQFMGVALIAKRGQPLFRKAYGWADAEWDVANTPDAKFRLGSITKQFTATAILQLVEQGKINLDDPVSKYYLEAPKTWEKITIHHLLNHTSGIPSYTALPDFFQKRSMSGLSPLEIVKLTEDQPLEFQPGERWKYNNTGYVLLGYIIEKVTGITYARYLREHIFDPAGMKDSGYDTHGMLLKRRAQGYTVASDGIANARYLDMSLPFSAGSLYSTVDDLLRWDQALYGDKILSAASKEKMFTAGKNHYGYGWDLSERLNRKAMGHGGGINGFNTYILRFPEEQVLVVVLSNLSSGVIDRMALDLARMAFGEPAGADRNVRPTNPSLTK